jgi:hypothetical protein
MTDLHWTESFRPVKSNDTLVDKHKHLWKRLTKNGWVRQCDNFFWPADPTIEHTYMGCFPHTVEQVSEMRKRHKAKK